MKYKYLTIIGNELFWGKNEITKETLTKVLAGQYDVLLNLEDLTWFNAPDNKWEEISGDTPPHLTGTN